MKIVVTGQIARYPLGGVTWDWLNYLLGFRKLGHQVHYFEDGPEWLYNPLEHSVTISNYNVNYLKKVMDKFGFSSNWTYITRLGYTSSENNKIYGNKDIKKIFQSADVVFNICGSSNMGKLVNDYFISKKIKKIYVDCDPMINQLKMIREKNDPASIYNSHDLFFTYAENINKKDCKIPIQKGLKWNTTRFPVYLPEWPYKFNKKSDTFTTVANWQSYKGFIYKGKKYSGCKSIEFLKFSNLPRLSNKKFELAITADTKRKEGLKEKRWISNKGNLQKMIDGGWKITNALKISKNWRIYEKYIESSKAEFSVAKPMYVIANTGWFSGRSTCYLASGRPVILEETGFSKFIPTGRGLFSFKNKDEAAKAINEVSKNYAYHSKKAREIAEKYFNSDIILSKMLQECKISKK